MGDVDEFEDDIYNRRWHGLKDLWWIKHSLPIKLQNPEPWIQHCPLLHILGAPPSIKRLWQPKLSMYWVKWLTLLYPKLKFQNWNGVWNDNIRTLIFGVHILNNVTFPTSIYLSLGSHLCYNLTISTLNQWKFNLTNLHCNVQIQKFLCQLTFVTLFASAVIQGTQISAHTHWNVLIQNWPLDLLKPWIWPT